MSQKIEKIDILDMVGKGVQVLAVVNVTRRGIHQDDTCSMETGLLLAGRSELSDVVNTNIAQFQCPSKLSTKLVAAVAAQQHVEDNTART